MGRGSTVIVIPKTFAVERGTPFLVDRDQEGRITYTPIDFAALKEKAKS